MPLIVDHDCLLPTKGKCTLGTLPKVTCGNSTQPKTVPVTWPTLSEPLKAVIRAMIASATGSLDGKRYVSAYILCNAIVASGNK